jgi:mannose-1-phosphate guanylyltransferase/mannose-6-phosphate isomerase
MSSPVYTLLLAGGSGTRLWPLSSEALPKHLVRLNGDSSLLQETVRRLKKLVPAELILTVAHESQTLELKKQLAGIDKILAEKVLSEPIANNTLPAIAWGVANIEKKEPQALVGIFPADHLIQNEKALAQDFQKAARLAAEGFLVTFGIKPALPETGYGYIKRGKGLAGGAFEVAAFVEKPDRKTAERYLKEGDYYWNSGIFVFKASDFQEELKRLEPKLFASIQKIVDSGNDPAVLKKEYSQMSKQSVDYGIMEKAKKVAVIEAGFSWSDLGSWESIYKVREKDRNGNAVEGNVIALDTQNSLLISKKGILAAIGLKDLVVVKTGDSVLVAPRNRVQETKQVAEELKKRGEAADLSDSDVPHATVKRPWGTYTVLEEGVGYKIKRITVDPGQKLSLQNHRQRAEHWVVVEGTAKVVNGDRQFLLKQNESTFIPQGEKHRLENPTENSLLTIIEVQTGSYLGEDDIQRFEDIYGRTQ